MDGQQRRPIVSSNLVWPNGLTIDIQSQSLYWADAMLDKIESSNADGTNRHVLTTIGIFHPFSLTVHESQLYWSDWEMDVILTGSSDIYLNARLLARLNGSRPMGIKAVSSANQPSGIIVDTQVRGNKNAQGVVYKLVSIETCYLSNQVNLLSLKPVRLGFLVHLNVASSLKFQFCEFVFRDLFFSRSAQSLPHQRYL